MKTLWAPWRIEYVLSKKGPECLFCTIAKQKQDRENLILYRGTHMYIVMNRYPYNNGHLMVVPYIHTSDFRSLGKDALAEMMELTKFSTECLSEVMRPEGFNTGLNIGRAAGAGIDEHLHVHIVPRWVGDSSFMAVTEETRVIPEHLRETYDKIHPVMNRHA
jgi:ATP adenylyltransferase